MEKKEKEKTGRKCPERKGRSLLVLGFPGRSFTNVIKQNKTCSGFRASPAKKQKLDSRDPLWLFQILKKKKGENI